MDPFSLAGRTALVTGASRGIGAATARALDRAGARVALVARSREDLEAVARELGNDPVVVVADLGEVDAPAEVARQALDALGSVDVLVNNAAIAARLPTVETDAAVIDRVWKPIAHEQAERRKRGERATHRLSMLPGISRRSRLLLGPLQGLVVDA